MRARHENVMSRVMNGMDLVRVGMRLDLKQAHRIKYFIEGHLYGRKTFCSKERRSGSTTTIQGKRCRSSGEERFILFKCLYYSMDPFFLMFSGWAVNLAFD